MNSTTILGKSVIMTVLSIGKTLKVIRQSRNTLPVK